MSPLLLDLNDVELRVARGEEEILRSPGYATLVRGTVEVGERGHAEAWAHPRHSHNRHWQALDTTPLRHLGARIRHAGDLVWLHLDSLRRQAGNPGQAILLVPGIWQRAQLNLLLGIVQAAGMRVLALVEGAAAVGAALAPGRYLHLEACLHQSVLTHLEVDAATARCGAREQLTDLGYRHFEQRIVDCIVEHFLRQSRFDVLHDGSTEQLLHSQLAQWLALLGTREKITLTIDHRGARHEATLHRDALVAAVAPLRRELAAKAGAGPVLLDYRLARLPGLLDDWPNARALPASALLVGASHSPELHQLGSESLYLREQLACVPPEFRRAPLPPDPALPGGTATHLLVREAAYPLSTRAWHLTRRGTVQREAGPDALGAVRRDAHGARVEAAADSALRLNGRAIDGQASLAAGDHLTVAGAACLFVPIAVHGDDAA